MTLQYCPMVFGQMQSTLLETVGKNLHVPKYLGAPDAHVDPFCHLPTSLVIRLHSSTAFVLGTTEIPPQQKPFLVLSFTFKGIWRMTAKPQRDPSSQQTIVIGSGSLRQGEHHIHKLLGFINAPNNPSRAPAEKRCELMQTLHER